MRPGLGWGCFEPALSGVSFMYVTRRGLRRPGTAKEGQSTPNPSVATIVPECCLYLSLAVGTSTALVKRDRKATGYDTQDPQKRVCLFTRKIDKMLLYA